jgi:PAN domain
MSWTYLPGFGLPLALFLSSHAVAQTTFQPNTDRRTETDYEEFSMGRPTPQLCLDACLNSAPCRSWTFVKSPDGSAACRLGNQKQQPVPDPCCTSGTR